MQRVWGLVPEFKIRVWGSGLRIWSFGYEVFTVRISLGFIKSGLRVQWLQGIN